MLVSVKKLNCCLVFFVLLVLLAGCGNSSNSSNNAVEPPSVVDPPPVIDPPPVVDPPPYSISGTITAAPGSAIDGDSNDPDAAYISNDDPASAQQISNPVVLGGYLSAVATGVAGDRFAITADIQDWYRVTLVAGQTVSLTIADHDGNETNLVNPDFDLFLINPDTLADLQTSESYQRQETIRVLADGDYLLQVYAFDNSSNYLLTVGQTVATPAMTALRIEDDFIPGEVIVRLKAPGKATSGVTARSATAGIAALGLQQISGRPGAANLYRLQAGSPAARLPSSTAANGRSNAGNAEKNTKRETIDLVKQLRRRADVASADLNYIRRAQLLPNDPLFSSKQWNATLINLPAAWELTTGDPNVVVAVLDSGLLMSHPDLLGRLCSAGDACRGYDFVANLISAADGNGIDPAPDDPGDQSFADGTSSFHGTHVAGIIGAAGNNTTGVAGVDWAAMIMPVRVLGVERTGTSHDLIQGLRYAAGLANDSGTVPSKTANIVNLSLGGDGYSQAEQDAITELYTAGIIVVAAAGNGASSLPFYPASYNGVVAVSAVASNKDFAAYSNFGATIDVAAPGGSIVAGVTSTSGDDSSPILRYTYVSYMGTSMAAPHVSGVAALMLAEDPAMTPADFDLLLAAGKLTEDLAADGATVADDYFGFGLIDAQKSVLAAIDLAGGASLPPSLAITPSLLDFGPTTTSLPLTLTNLGGGTLRVTGISFSASWITSVTLVSETPVGSGLGDYLISVDRSGLADAIYSANISLTTDLAGVATVNVLLQVGSSAVGDAGRQLIRLVDANSGTILQTVSATADPHMGTYPYRFNDVMPGRYQVMSSSDLDHDGKICDAGEACGSYPALIHPTSIEVSSDRQYIDFSTFFDSNR